MKTYFTSDFHLGSSNVIEYSHRPFENAGHMNDVLIRRVNQMLDKHDVLFHVGDFMLAGYDRHDVKHDYSDIKIETYLDQIKPHIILLNGNHDSNHNCHAMCNYVYVNLNKNWKNISVSHLPITKSYESLKIHLCGHVHFKWLANFDKNTNVLNINVGVDVWDYRPVDSETLVKVIEDLTSDKELMSESFSLTKLEFQEFRHQKNLERAKAQSQKTKERHLKKGLTPEECQRRKEEAMRLKSKVSKL